MTPTQSRATRHLIHAFEFLSKLDDEELAELAQHFSTNGVGGLDASADRFVEEAVRVCEDLR